MTGGFRNTGPMAKAIKEHTCDVIGLGRPLCAEPNLPALILSGKSNGAMENSVPEPMQTPAAVIQVSNRPTPEHDRADAFMLDPCFRRKTGNTKLFQQEDSRRSHIDDYESKYAAP